MCIRVRFAPIGSAPVFDPATRTIALPPGLDRAHTVIAARAVLAELAVVQPRFGAVCYCGAEVDLTPRIPQQRAGEQAVTHGA
ncbi:hypothetical protein [Streptomyces sp. LN549]|uniref:hypothetical protein n=1 Tax=Streptomyces sp. LN549 TaxID=3112979 RepID=UPI0037165571